MGLFYTHPPCHDPTPLPNAPICTDELQESTKGRGRGSLPVRTSALLAEEGIHVHTYSALRAALVKHGLPWNFHHAAGVLIGVRHNLSIVWKCPYVAASILVYLVCAITKLLDIKHPPPAPDKNGTTCPAPFEAHPPPPLPPPDPHTLVKQTYPTLTFAQLNVGGVEITPNRLCHILSGFLPQPHTISLQEFRPSSTSHIRQHQRVAKYWGYHLLHSTPSRKEGVALLVHTSISPVQPHIHVHIPGRFISTTLPLHENPLMPPVRVASFYGPHTLKEKHTTEPHLEKCLRECAIILGDYNAVTHSSHTTALRPNIWPWLVAKERSSALTDLLTPHCTSTPFTRVRRYGGTRSYIDRAYGTRMFASLFQSTSARVIDFSAVTGAQDHDPIVICTVPWSSPQVPEPRCALWNRRDVQRYQSRIIPYTHHLPLPESPEDASHTYKSLTQHMLRAMRETNEQKGHQPSPATDPSDWSAVVKQLARQAKRRSKVFYRRVKHSLLTPPAQSTLPVPTRKIQRILQRNTPWCRDALDIIHPQPRVPDVPPPHLRCAASAC